MKTIAHYDHEGCQLLSAGIDQLINSFGSFKSVITSDSFEEIRAFVFSKHPDILILSFNQLRVEQKQVFLRLSELSEQVKVVLLTNKVSKWILRNLSQYKIDGYFVMKTDPQSLKIGLERIADGQPFCCHEVSSELMRFSTEDDIDFSDKELDIIKLIADGVESKEIADLLCMSKHTIYACRKAILKKVGATCSIGLVKYAIEMGLVD